MPKTRAFRGCTLGDRASLPAVRRHRARGRRGAAGLRWQDSREVHTQLRRYRMDADVGRARLDDDRSGSRPVLWWHGAQEERGRHGDDQLCRHLPRHHSVRALYLQHGVSRRLAVHRRPGSDVPEGHSERHRQSGSSACGRFSSMRRLRTGSGDPTASSPPATTPRW